MKEFIYEKKTDVQKLTCQVFLDIGFQQARNILQGKS
jgi:hypothetical protein